MRRDEDGKWPPQEARGTGVRGREGREKGRSTLGCSEVPVGRWRSWRYWRSQNKTSHGSSSLHKAPSMSSVKTLKILQPSLRMGRVSEAPRGSLSSSVRGPRTTMKLT